MQKKFKLVLFLAVVVAIVITIGATAFTQLDWKNEVGEIPENDYITLPRYEYLEDVLLIPFNLSQPVYNEYTEDYRPMYTGLEKHHYDWYFSELPKVPEDFFSVAQLVYDGKVTDYERLPSECYLQPEFYPGWWGTLDTKYLGHTELRWTPEGYGCYPLIKQITVKEKGTKAVVTTYFKTGYATHSYQGLIVRPYLPDDARNIRGEIIFNQPNNAEKYFKLKILNPDDELYLAFKDSIDADNVEESDWMTILKPTHQVIRNQYGRKLGETGFPDDWVRVLQIELDISKDTPSGDYVVAIKVDAPCHEINQEYYYANDHPYFGGRYYPGGNFFRSNTPHFQVVVHIP